VPTQKMQLLVQQLAEFKALTDTPNHSLSIAL